MYSVSIITVLTLTVSVMGKSRHESLPPLHRSIHEQTTNNTINDKQYMNGSSDPKIPWRTINFISPSQSLAQSRWWHDTSYNFSAKGMDHLYLLTEWVIDTLQPPGLPSGIITDQILDDPETVLRENRGKLLSHFWGLLLTATICLCIAVIVPLIGFLICCCWCNSGSSKRAKHIDQYNSSSSSSPVHRRTVIKRDRYVYEKSCDPCFRWFFSVNLFILLLLMSFFVICAFVTNEYVRSGIHQLPKSVNQSMDDVMLYLNNTQYEVNTLLRTNFGQLEQELGNSLDKSGLIVKNRLALVSHASALENLTEIVIKLDSILSDLRLLSSETSELTLLLHQLQQQLFRTRRELEQFFQQCTDPVCVELRRRYHRIMNSFTVSARVDTLPDLSPLMANISQLLKGNIVLEVKRGKEAFDEISIKIQSVVNDTIPAIKRQIKAVGHELSLAANDINEALRRPFADLHNVKHHMNNASHYIDKYEVYRWYGFIIGTSIVFGILTFYSFGLMFGACSHQPTRHNYRHRSKSSPRIFKCGITLTFLLFAPILIIAICLFLTGGIADKVLCYYLQNPQKSQTRQLVAVLQKKFEQYNVADSINLIQGVKPNFADVLLRCNQNMSLYAVLQLNRYNHIQLSNGKIVDGFNISTILSLKDRYRIEERLNVFLDRVNVNPSNVIILTSEGHELLERLKDTSLGTLNFSSYAQVVKDSITPLDLVSISNELEHESGRLPKSDVENVAKLRNIAMDLKADINLVVKIKDTIERLSNGAEKIEKKAQYGNKGLKEALNDLLLNAEIAQKFITQRGREEIQNVAQAFVTDMSSLVDQYAQHVVDEVENGIGRCEPISRAVNASAMTVCKEIVLPLNGFWFSLTFALLLSIPATIFAYILSCLYQRVKRDRHRRGSDSTLDHLDDDDIPLAHKNNSNTGYEGRSSGMYNDRISSAAPSAPVPIGDDNWSPGAPPPHLYGSRPPPYNFSN